MKHSLTTTYCKIIVAYRTLNRRLSIETEQWTPITISRDTRLCHFSSYNGVKNEEHFVLECPLNNPISEKFPWIFKNVVLGSLESFFQLDHQVGSSLYLIKAIALRHSRELTGLKPSQCTFSTISILASRTLKSISFDQEWRQLERSTQSFNW